MRRTLTVSVITILCFSGFAFAARSEENPENFMQMHMIESKWHQAATTKNVDLMMSLFADDAAVTSGGKTYTGKDQIRRFWQAGKAFQPQSKLIGYTRPTASNTISRATAGISISSASMWITQRKRSSLTWACKPT